MSRQGSGWGRVAAVLGSSSSVGRRRFHGGSYDLKYVDGSNVELVTFNTHVPVAEMDIIHNIRLYDLLGAPVPYEQVEVEFHSRDRDLTAGRKSLLHAETLPMLATNESMLTWRYPVQGDYTLKLRFVAGGRTVSQGQLAVAVGRPTGSAGFDDVVARAGPHVRAGCARLPPGPGRAPPTGTLRPRRRRGRSCRRRRRRRPQPSVVDEPDLQGSAQPLARGCAVAYTSRSLSTVTSV